MASTIWEFFGYRSDDFSPIALKSAADGHCPYINAPCQKRFRDNVVSGVCTLQQKSGARVICCPIRLYADGYDILNQVAEKAFGSKYQLISGVEAANHARTHKEAVIAVFGRGWGGELRLPQKSGRGGYFVDWVLALIDENGDLIEFTAVEVQTIDTTNSYRNGYEALLEDREIIDTKAGLNWENVNKRILPQLIYKGQVLQREELCKKGLFFVCPQPVYARIMERLGGEDGLIKYALQPASITFMAYEHKYKPHEDAETVPLVNSITHSTTVYKVQEAFNNVTLPDENVYKKAILKALNKY